jgi:hypothetical protein
VVVACDVAMLFALTSFVEDVGLFSVSVVMHALRL